MSTYFDILLAVQGKVQALPSLGGAKVVARPEIAYLKDAGDTTPLVVVALKRDGWEQPSAMFFDGTNSTQGGVRLDHAVIVAVIIDNAFDLQQLEWQTNVREDVRRVLWDARAVSGVVTTVSDCAYDPAPRGVDLSALAPPLDCSLQMFVYTSDEARYVP